MSNNPRVKNTKGLKNHAQKKKTECMIRFSKAIQDLIDEDRPINFNTVSKQGNISTAWLYKTKEVRKKIELLRKQQVKVNDKKKTINEESKTAIILTLKNRIKLQATEIQDLKKQIEVLYGQIITLERKNSL
ncbi:DUF6262 family protein [Lysinibacillus sp. C5.1]|uniref:DUF6262 family protein n=1 Tax=Lysinibacillus sp. C5.1 TaxID=2796169 RepID=UPI0030813010